MYCPELYDFCEFLKNKEIKTYNFCIYLGAVEKLQILTRILLIRILKLFDTSFFPGFTEKPCAKFYFRNTSQNFGRKTQWVYENIFSSFSIFATLFEFVRKHSASSYILSFLADPK
jgi:hypothetical protein